MECVQCGASLRHNARFCNVCGASQPLPARMPAPLSPAADEDDAGGMRVKRPPRVPRQLDELDISEQETSGPHGAITQQLPDHGTLDHLPAAEVAAWEDADTLESLALASSAGQAGHRRAEPLAGSAPHNRTEPLSSEPLPWPLTPGSVVGGRFRVQALQSASADPAAGENVYLAADLKGYERCWSCGKEYGPEGESERFCRECGADMLAREYVMHERLAAAESAPAGAALAEAGVEEWRFTQAGRDYRVAPRVVEPSPFPRGQRLIAAWATDTGKSRPGEYNEDSLAAFVLARAHDSYSEPLALAIVADGLGGHVSGQDASRLVVRVLADHLLRAVAIPSLSLRSSDRPPFEALREVMLEGARAANAALFNANRELGADMGSTLVAALVVGDTACIVNAGDSRAYVFDGEGLRRITTDHSLVEQLIAGGIITPEDRYTHPQRSQIFRSLGAEQDQEVDIFEQRLRPGMRLLLCSDGLWEMVRDDALARVLRETPHPQEACDRLIQAANEHGGEDNISAVILDVHA